MQTAGVLFPLTLFNEHPGRQTAESRVDLGSSVVPVCAQQPKWRKNVMCAILYFFMIHDFRVN